MSANQNTHIYGRLDGDGIWRDPKDGSVLEDAGSTKGGVFSSLKGLSGALKRVQSVSYLLDSLHAFVDVLTEAQEGSRDLSGNERISKLNVRGLTAPVLYLNLIYDTARQFEQITAE